MLETTASGLSRFGADMVVRHHLLAASCHLGLGDAGAAQDALAPALLFNRVALRKRRTLTSPACVPQAQALAARL